MSTPKIGPVKMNCFSSLTIENPKDKQESIQESIKEDKDFIINCFAQQPYYSELMPKIKKASRGIVFYRGLISKGVKHKSVFFEAIMRSIKKVNEEKLQKRPKSKKKIGLYKLPKIEELRIKKKKIENIKNGKKKIKLIQLEKGKKNEIVKEQEKGVIFPATTINSKSPLIYSTNTMNNFINFNNHYLNNNNTTYNSFNKNANISGKFEQNLILSPINNDLSTYYKSKSNDTTKNLSRNSIMFKNIKDFQKCNSTNDLNYIMDKCKEEIITGREVEESVSNYNKNFMKEVQEIINNNKIINRDKKIIEEKNKRNNKYIKLEEKNYAKIKKRMNEKISNSLAYKNRKELLGILKSNENAKSYMLQLNEMNKINEKLGRRRVIEWKRIEKVNSLCDIGYRKNEYLKNKIDIINNKNDKISKSNDIIINDNVYENKNNKYILMGKLVPKLISLRSASEKKTILGI